MASDELSAPTTTELTVTDAAKAEIRRDSGSSFSPHPSKSPISPAPAPTPLPASTNIKHHHTIPKPVVPPKWNSVRQIIVHATSGGLRSFLLGYALRGGIASLIKTIFFLRGKTTLKSALSAFYAPTSTRFAAMIGSFSFLWKLINNLLAHTSDRSSKLHGMIAGGIAGSVALLFEEKESRIAIAQQFFVRSMQAGYNALKARELVHFPHGDSALFMLSCASILYALIIQPTTIPPEYYRWMVNICQVSHPILDFNRTHVAAYSKGITLPDTAKRMTSLIEHRPKSFTPQLVSSALGYLNANNGQLPLVPCSVLHPSSASCLTYNAQLWPTIFRDIGPVYLALNFVPLLLFKPKVLLHDPVNVTKRNLVATARSAVFLAAFISIFQVMICAQRNLALSSLPIPNVLRRDHRYWYYFVGMCCSSSIFLEHKQRRSELAMYVAPKAFTSAWKLLHQRGVMTRIPGFEILMGGVSMGLLMSVYQTEPERMSGLLFRVMDKMIGRN
ncbi:uncharacterized protein EV422DRAFT_526037 [Fimicolochytrium jonesii]|uniref:uncharacterized protein n=1 Tax=Fimicolochytrium jonesii TaxID=1396493 RepID=UPI0022FF2D10|nr:uncharacterized protein EV422DRAFT_526037 [Fimicolochytrium jonesii]KAI8822204.1 hypothetical protein EV422DRAFT_526037 [Fimicolochytrium jonesii]